MSRFRNPTVGRVSSGTSQWLSATTVATLFLAAVIPAIVYAAVLAFGYRIVDPSGISRVTIAFLVLFGLALVQAIPAQRGVRWPHLINWFLGLWLTYWVWGLVLGTFGYDKPILSVLLADNIHPAMWGFPMTLALIWWLRPSGIAVRRGVDIALVVLVGLIALRVAFGAFLPDSQNIFGWTTGFGWWGLSFEQEPPAPRDDYGPTWMASYHFNVYGVSVRPSFIFEHANTFGFLAAFGLVYGLTRRGALGWVLAAVYGFFLVSSTSNTSVVAALAGIATLLTALFVARKWNVGIRLAVGIVAVVILIVSAWRLSFDAFNFMGRRPQWEEALSSVDVTVFVGTGGESWVQSVIQQIPSVGSDLHNSFLSALAWSGLIGLVLFVSLWAVGLWLGVRAAKAGNLITLALLGTCFVSSLTESTFAYRYWSMGNALLLVAVLLSQSVSTRARQLQPS